MPEQGVGDPNGSPTPQYDANNQPGIGIVCQRVAYNWLTSVRVVYSMYADDKPRFVPNIGIVCKDAESFKKALDAEADSCVIHS